MTEEEIKNIIFQLLKRIASETEPSELKNSLGAITALV